VTTIGRVEYDASIDGKRLPAEARKFGRQAGGEMGASASKAFSSEFDETLTKYGKTWVRTLTKDGRYAGLGFSQAMRDVVRGEMNAMVSDMADVFGRKGGIEQWASRMTNAGEAVETLRANLARMNAVGAISERQYEGLSKQVDQYERNVTAARVAQAEMNLEQSEFNRNAKSVENALDSLAATHENARFRQWQADVRFNQALQAQFDHIKAVDAANREYTAEMEKAAKAQTRTRTEVDKTTASLDKQGFGWKSLSHNTRQWTLIIGAVMAAGGEIAPLGSAIGSSITVAAGAFGAAAIGTGVLIAALQDLNGELEDLPAAIQPVAAAWQGLGDEFSLLQDLIQETALRDAVGDFESLRVTVEALRPAFEVVAEAVGRVIGNFADSIAPGTQGFQNLFDLISAAGPVFETLANAGMTFFQALGNVFVASIPFVELFAGHLQDLAGEFLAWTNSIEGQQALQEWFENGVTIMSALEPLIGAVADALAGLVTPETIALTVGFLDTLTQLAPILGEFLLALAQLDLFGIIADLLLAVFIALQPLLPAFGEFGRILSEGLSLALMQLAPMLAQLVASLAPILPIIAELAVQLLLALIPVFPPLIDAFIMLIDAIVPLLPSLTDLAVLFAERLVEAIVALIPVVIPLIESFVNLLAMLTPLMPAIIVLIQAGLIPLKFATEVLLPILAFLIDLFVMILEPIRAIFGPMSDNADMMGILGDATNDLEGVMSGFEGMIEGWGAAVNGVLGGVIDTISSVIGWFQSLFATAAQEVNAPNVTESGRGRARLAAGALVTSETRATIGETGSEMVVPLQRPLSQVDPAVRQVAAFAQGRLPGGGGTSSVGKQVNFQEGSIVVQSPVADGTIVAEQVVDRIAIDADI
jgi:phage-related protein